MCRHQYGDSGVIPLSSSAEPSKRCDPRNDQVPRHRQQLPVPTRQQPAFVPGGIAKRAVPKPDASKSGNQVCFASQLRSISVLSSLVLMNAANAGAAELVC